MEDTVKAEWHRASAAAQVSLPEPDFEVLAKTVEDGMSMDLTWADIRMALRLVVGATSPLTKYHYSKANIPEFDYQDKIRTGKVSRERAMLWYVYYLGGEDC